MLVKNLMTANPTVMDAKTGTIAEAIDKMKGLDINQVPAMDGKKYVGMINFREVLRRRSLKLSAKIENYVVNTPFVSPDDDVSEVIRLLNDTGLSAFPVLEKDKLSGIISRTDIIKNLGDIMTGKALRNRQIMSSDPIVAQESETVDGAAISMRGLGESEIPVVDKEGKLTGILRLDEIADNTFRRDKKKIRGSGNSSGDRAGEREKVEITCASLMDNPEWVHPEDSIIKTAETLDRRRLHIAPVVDENMKVVGVVGTSDIIEALDEREKEGMNIIVSGLDPDEWDIYEITYSMAAKFLSRFSRITGISHGRLNIHVAKHHSEGRTKYSVRTKIVAEPLTMSLDHYDWNYGKCLSFIFETYEPRLKKWKDKSRYPA